MKLLRSAMCLMLAARISGPRGVAAKVKVHITP
jgi:hypothetical protein